MAEAAPLGDSPRLEVVGLRHGYGAGDVLDGIDLCLARGETLAILGRSGSGKSTLLRCLSLIDQPREGLARLDGQAYMEGGRALFAPWEIRSKIVMVFQDYNLFPNMTARRNITLALEKTRGLPRAEADRVADLMADRLGIREVLPRYPQTLSGGQAQRLALARAMVLSPKVLLLDEITAALDPETIVDVVQAIRELRRAEDGGDLTIVLVTHLIDFARRFADRIAMIHRGKILEEGPAATFVEQSRHPETRAFFERFVSPA